METRYRTDDINLTSFLLTQNGISFIGIEQDNPRHFVFILSSADKCVELKSKYFNNIEVPVLDLFSKKEMLISEIKHFK